MPIDTEVKGSPGWWLQRQFQRLNFQGRQLRLWRLHNYRIGRAPLPVGAENAREAFAAFVRQARSNFAELICAAMSERTIPVGFRTALNEDETGDAEVGAYWEQTGLDVTSADVHDLMFSLGEGYVVVGGVDDETGAPLVTKEDPRWMVGEPDPANPRRLLAALKVLHDDAAGENRAYLYLPGRATSSGRAQVWVAKQPSASQIFGPNQLIPDYWDVGPLGYPGIPNWNASGVPQYPVMGFSAAGWDWDYERSGELSHPLMPVVPFFNKDHMGEFEAHTDLLDRINHQCLQRMMIATLQAFRQRAVKGLPLTDKDGKEIDYSDIFTMDPAALWMLPATAEMWESGQVDLTPILSAVKDDVQQLAAVTRTPMSLMMPAGVNQSAEGASLQREGLVHKCIDRITRTSFSWARTMSLVLLQMGKRDQADLAKLRTLWAPPERLSLTEKADASIKATNDIPRRSRLIHIWGFAPAEADRMMTEWTEDMMLNAQIAASAALVATEVAPPSRGSARGGIPGGSLAEAQGRELGQPGAKAALPPGPGNLPQPAPAQPTVPLSKVPTAESAAVS